MGVYFPYDDYEKTTISFLNALRQSACKLFSFELKRIIDFSHLREYYFQAVSNSSWANEGYLVALKYGDDPTLLDEMRRLNNSFGIGFIQLNAENIEQSEIFFSAKYHNLDWQTINRLVEENSDFATFIKSVNEDIQLGIVKSKYDEVFEDTKYDNYLIEKNIT